MQGVYCVVHGILWDILTFILQLVSRHRGGLGSWGQLSTRSICKCHIAVGHSIFNYNLFFITTSRCKHSTKRPRCCRCPLLCMENWDNVHHCSLNLILEISRGPPYPWAISVLNHLYGGDFFPYSHWWLCHFLSLLGTWEKGWISSLALLPNSAFPLGSTAQSILTLQSSFLWVQLVISGGEAHTPHPLSCGEEMSGVPREAVTTGEESNVSFPHF